MKEARPVLPTDLLALVSYNGRSYRNEAWTRERLGADASPHTLGLVLDQFLAFARGRSAWISVRRQRLQGLVGARQRGGRQAWELDYLIDATPDHDSVAGLLDCAIADVGRSGAEKLFLRLAADSELFEVVREAGFLPYREELLFAKGPTREPPHDSTVELRPVVPADSYGIYRLYNAMTPEQARRSEAATFTEWHAAQERRWLKNGVTLLKEKDGRIVACARAARLHQGVAVELLLEGTALDDAERLVSRAAHAVEAESVPVFVLVPRTAEALAVRLEDAGFSCAQEFISMLRRTTRPQALPKLVPAVAKTVGA